MRAAADAEDKTNKHVITPGPLAPARELYGEMLLDSGMAKEALAAFEATKAKEPNRFHGFLGAARAAEKAGDKEGELREAARARQRLELRAAGARGGAQLRRDELAASSAAGHETDWHSGARRSGRGRRAGRGRAADP